MTSAFEGPLAASRGEDIVEAIVRAGLIPGPGSRRSYKHSLPMRKGASPKCNLPRHGRAKEGRVHAPNRFSLEDKQNVVGHSPERGRTCTLELHLQAIFHRLGVKKWWRYRNAVTCMTPPEAAATAFPGWLLRYSATTNEFRMASSFVDLIHGLAGPKSRL